MEVTGTDDPFGSSSPPPRRGAAVFAVLAVVAGFAGGFAAGYAANDGGDGDDATVAAVGTGSDADVVTDDGSHRFAADGVAAATTVTTAMGEMPGVPSMPVRERLFKRTSSSGHSVRVFSNEDPQLEPPECGEEGTWCPPPECSPNASIEVLAVGEWSITLGGAPWYPLRDGDVARVLGQTFPSHGDDDAVFGVIVRTAPSVQTVRLSSGGQTDEMAPIDGLAVVVVPATGTGSTVHGGPSDARVEVVDASGATSELTRFLPGAGPECTPPPPPPPPLPEPGEQPDDPAAADAAVRQVVQDVFGPETPDALERSVDDPAGLAEGRERLKERYPEQSTGNSEYEVADLVFTSPTQAVFQFRAVIPNYATLPWLTGSARVVDGEWMLTRDTVCTLYRLGGVTC